MIDWSKKVVTALGAEVIKLDDDFVLTAGSRVILVKVLPLPPNIIQNLLPKSIHELAYKVPNEDLVVTITGTARTYSIKNEPIKHQGWIAIYANKPMPSSRGTFIRMVSDAYLTQEECQRAMNESKIKVLCYRTVEWEE